MIRNEVAWNKEILSYTGSEFEGLGGRPQLKLSLNAPDPATPYRYLSLFESIKGRTIRKRMGAGGGRSTNKIFAPEEIK